MKRILFYYPSNKASVQIETTLLALKREGIDILLLTTCEKGLLHQRLEENGIETYTYSIPKNLLYYPKQILFLIEFCKSKQIDFVFGNLQHTNFISVLAQAFIKAKVINFRHHFKFNKGNYGIPIKVNKNEALFDKIINRLSKKIIVPSLGVYNGIKEFEKINLNKLSIIPYLYDFSLYPSPNQEKVNELQSTYAAELRIVMIARLIPFKRHILMLPVFKKLIEKGFDIQVLILDEGPEKNNLENYIKEEQLEKQIHLLGFQKNIIDFMAASDLIVHPSLTEASNNVIKEIGLQEKAVMVCNKVGDFDEYIEHGVNGYFMDIVRPEVDAQSIIEELYHNKAKRIKVGKALRTKIIAKFGNNDNALRLYHDLLNEV